MRRKTRAKVKKGIKITGVIIGIALIIIGIILVIRITKKEKKSYDDGIVCKNFFTQIKIDLSTKKVKRDQIDTTLQEEFGISEEQEELAFTSVDEMKNLLSNSVFDISINDQKITIKNHYQTKNLIVEAEDIGEKVKGEEIIKLYDNIYILNFYSEKLTKEMYNFYKNKRYIKNIYLDEVLIDNPLSEISQTMYGSTEVDLKGFHSLGVTDMGIDKYQNVIYENGNPSDVVIATIGYGMDIENEIFENKIDQNYYNFILNNKDVSETIAQGSRIGEVLADSSTQNIKIMPLVTVTEEGYTSISSILKAISYSIKRADVICYELMSTQNDAIDLMLENAFKENVPVCTVSSNNEENYPAKHKKTIATASIDRNLNIADYSSKGDFIDFSAPSTDIEEIFKKNSTVSRWSGPQYSNAQIASIIALVKTYNKQASVIDIYKFIMNFTVDLGEEGKDKSFGLGMPNFKGITISDIDKESPEFGEITFDNENWEILKQLKITAKDNIRIYAWGVTENENIPQDSDWKTLESLSPTLDVASQIEKNGKYTIWVRDSAGNTINNQIEINKIDTEGPKIAYEINKDTISQGYVTINVTAEDEASGLSDSPFSWDNITWTQDNSQRIVKQNGRYTVYALDNLGNISSQEILIDCFPQEGIYELGEGNLISSVKVSADWTGNVNNNVQIVLNNNIRIAGWQISLTPTVPATFVPVSVETPRENSNTTNNSSSNQQNRDNYDIPNNININNQNTSNQNNSSQNTNSTETNTTAQNTAAQNTTSNTTSNNNEQNQSTEQTEQYVPTEPIKIVTSLEVDTIYYLWVKHPDGTVEGQVIKISKAPI